MCPTCGVTMQKVNDGVPRTFWCPRCGTLKMEGGMPEHEAPRFLRTALLCLDVYSERYHAAGDPGPFTGVLWAKVGYLLALGCTTSMALCRALGFDPEHKAD